MSCSEVTQRTFPSVQDVVSPHATLKPMQTDPSWGPWAHSHTYQGPAQMCPQNWANWICLLPWAWDLSLGMLKAPGQLCRWKLLGGFFFNNAYVFLILKIMLLTCMLLTENSCNAEREVEDVETAPPILSPKCQPVFPISLDTFLLRFCMGYLISHYCNYTVGTIVECIFFTSHEHFLYCNSFLNDFFFQNGYGLIFF